MNPLLQLRFTGDIYEQKANLASLLAAMLWPDDPETGLDYVKWRAKGAMLPHRSEFSPPMQQWFDEEVLAQDFDIDALDGQDMRRRLVHGRIAGRVLELRLAGWTMQHAKDAIARSRSDPKAYPGLWNVGAGHPKVRVKEDTVQGKWRRFRCVAHYWAASFALGTSSGQWLPHDSASWVQFLEKAEEFRERGEEKKILIPTETWHTEVTFPKPK